MRSLISAPCRDRSWQLVAWIKREAWSYLGPKGVNHQQFGSFTKQKPKARCQCFPGSSRALRDECARYPHKRPATKRPQWSFACSTQKQLDVYPSVLGTLFLEANHLQLPKVFFQYIVSATNLFLLSFHFLAQKKNINWSSASVATEEMPSCSHCMAPSTATGMASLTLAPPATPKASSCSSSAPPRPSASQGTGKPWPPSRLRRDSSRLKEAKEWKK